MNDHYVAQTYLEAFVNAEGMLIPYYKAKSVVLGKPKTPKAVCFEIDGDTNKYFTDPRILDKYLPQFENPWKKNVQALRDRFLDGMVKYQISGYVAFLRSCTPAAKRLGQERLRAAIQSMVQSVAERQFKLHPPKDEETSQIIKNLIEQKQITTEIDRQFPHAIGISQLLRIIVRFLNGRWLVMINESNRPFITSDNPAIAYYHNNDATMAQIYVPLAPDIAILMAAEPDDNESEDIAIRNSASLNDCFAVPKTQYIDKFNELIIRGSEERVLHRSFDKQLEQKVRANAEWRADIVTDNIAVEKGTFVITREIVRKIKVGRATT